MFKIVFFINKNVNISICCLRVRVVWDGWSQITRLETVIQTLACNHHHLLASTTSCIQSWQGVIAQSKPPSLVSAIFYHAICCGPFDLTQLMANRALQASATISVSQRWSNFCSMVGKNFWIKFGTQSTLRHTAFRIPKKNCGL